MQGQRSSIESFPETLEFDHLSSSSNRGMDQQVYWNNMVLDPVGNSNLPDYLLSPTVDTNMSYLNATGQENARMSIWSPGGPSSNNSVNQGSHNEIKMEHEWPTSLTIDSGGSTRIEERQPEAASTLSLENVDINLNNNHVANDHSSSHDSILVDAHQSSDQNVGRDGIISQVVHTGISPPPYNPSLFESGCFTSSSGSSNRCGKSSMDAGFLSEDGDGRPGSALDGRRISCKRKNIEGGAGPSSSNASSSSFYQSENSLLPSLTVPRNIASSMSICCLPEHVAAPNASEVRLDQRSGAIMTGLACESYPSLNIAEHAESSQRNLRRRINPAHQHDMPPPNLLLSGNGSRHRTVRSSRQPSSLLVPVNQLLVSRPAVPAAASQSQARFSFVPSWPQNVQPAPWNGTPNSRIGGASISANSAEGLTASREETSSRSIARNGIPDYSLFGPSADVRQLTQDPTNWNLTNANMNMSGNVASTSRAGTSSGVHPLAGATWTPGHDPSTERALSMSDVLRQSLFPSGVPEPGSQSTTMPLPHTNHSVSSHGRGHQSVTGFRGNQQPLRRSTVFMDRQNDGVPGIPLSIRSLAAREGRTRMISEIRNALDLMRRGENLRFEDVFMLDQSIFLSGADLHDRHRDMRLDVDNMSYEELLALEERIGNVSTGLSEETILKSLKQWRYILPIVVVANEVEPCCICQEDYIEGEELGTLDCGHDFHTACIKQWLMHKNLCPICKTAALGT